MQLTSLRAFIGRPKGSESAAIERYLVEAGAQPDDPTRRVSSAQPPAATLLESISVCDLGVLIYDPDSPYLLYELGALDALQKPVLIVVEGERAIPPSLLRYLVVRAPLSGSEELRSAIIRVVAEVRGSRPSKTRQRRAHSGATWSRSEERRPKSADANPIPEAESRQWPAERVERAVADLFESAGGFVEAHNYPGERGADFVLWSATASQVLPHPLLVEVKAGHLSESTLQEAEARLQRAVEKSGATGGLLVYLDRSGKHFDTEVAQPSVSRVSLGDLARTLSNTSLNTAVRRLLTNQPRSADG